MSEDPKDLNWSDRIKIVLVNTSHPGNIGAAARAMKNMALNRLVLVSPDEFPSGVAVGRAAGAVDLLDRAEVVDSLQEAVADCGLIIGTSARSRSIPWPMLDPEASAGKLVAESSQHPVALVFGREASGLNNEELQQCHFHVQIPANPGYSSLNLGAAVMVLGYELYKAHQATLADPQAAEPEFWDQPLASAEQVEHFYAHLERLLVTVDFHDPDNPRQLLQRLRRLYGRIRIDQMEMNILRGILTHIEQQLDAGQQD